MVLKVNDNEFFTLELKLDINYELEYINFLVKIHNKTAHMRTMKQFSAHKFSDALAYYRQQEKFLFGSEGD